ncbi:unnamed protein product [Penicillium salamii]|nr:unnamed protein product [Penicillium salamii]CAG8296251.1 unnamed protein product [Penicillium salamii]
MLRTALGACKTTYLVIDGLDECGRLGGKEIVSWFQELIEDLTKETMDSIRCLFVSQDDPVSGAPTIKVTAFENKGDLANFANEWQKRIGAKFEELGRHKIQIANILIARSQGMFIFAELMAKYLEDLPNWTSLREELRPERFPVKLEAVYSRIIERIFESRGDSIAMHMRQVLGWIVCAKRPLRWREIQGALSIDMEGSVVDYDKRLLESPKGLFAALVEMQADDTVELVHGTAREYLLGKRVVQMKDVDYSLSVLCMTYLSFPEFGLDRNDDEISVDIQNGSHAFYDYASACWAMHLQSGVPGSESGDTLEQLRETLEVFVELHWSSSAKDLLISSKLTETLAVLDDSEHFCQILQAVAWHNKQIDPRSPGPTADDALGLWQMTKRWRDTMEKFLSQTLESTQRQQIERFYGTNLFKCPRLNCFFYHRGFSTAEQRHRHISKHERPFHCIVSGCHVASFGCISEKELNEHLFDYHGIDKSHDLEFPDPTIRQISDKLPKKKSEAKFFCDMCHKVFTRNHNLKNHVRATHLAEKLYQCVNGHEAPVEFTRKDLFDRHMASHKAKEEKTYICQGSLKDGSTWGCKKPFPRADNLANHLKSRKGRKCIRPLMQQRLQDGTEQNEADGLNIFMNQTGSDSQALMAAGKLLPSFKEFLQICGPDRPSLTAEATS